jgi:hypothetical protein
LAFVPSLKNEVINLIEKAAAQLVHLLSQPLP